MIALRTLRRLCAAALSLGVLALPVCTAAAAVAPGLPHDPAVPEWCPVVPDRLYAAADTSVDLDRIRPDEPAWRSNCNALFRGDERPPESVFKDGLRPADVSDGEYDLQAYARREQPSPFVATTYDREFLKHQTTAYHYYIDAPGGIELDETLGTRELRSARTGVVFPGGVARQFIVKACPVDKATKAELTARCVPNPAYSPWRGWPAPDWTGVKEPAAPPPAVKPPAVKPPAVKPPAVKPPAAQSPSVKPSAPPAVQPGASPAGRPAVPQTVQQGAPPAARPSAPPAARPGVSPAGRPAAPPVAQPGAPRTPVEAGDGPVG
ncbi:scabin-related ADP-ribosyltransferase [Actinacidiphila glaucinigra]|uniref:scabin-related ADP-ribosyltransferase n=1 Tax=Actinacidiphila glaucinigra TaxID=235986 RepID=UPI00366D3269